MAYTTKQFNELRLEFNQYCSELLGIKEAEYADTDNRLQNFHEQALIQGLKPSQICLTHMLKHVLSIVKTVNSGNIKWSFLTPENTEGTKQRIADILNYTFLMAACLYEEFLQKTQDGRGEQCIATEEQHAQHKQEYGW